MSNEIDAKEIAIKDLFKESVFKVPNYQRSYVWDSDNVYKLLDDINTHCKNSRNDEKYFLGSLVLQRHDNLDIYDILDGQQRLTTILFIISVIRDLTKNENNRDKYIKEPKNSDIKVDKDTNRIDIESVGDEIIKKFCQKYVYDYNEKINIEDKLTQLKGILKEKNNNISLKNMATALITIINYFKEFSNEDLNKFAQTLISDVILVVVSATNREKAFRLFTILNSRGVPLANADILKAINLGEVENNKEQQEYADKWNEIKKSFEKDEFDRFLSHIRTILVKQKAKADLFTEFENIYKDYAKYKLKKGEETLELIQQYKNIYDIVMGNTNEDENGNKVNLENDYINLVKILDYAFSSTDWIPPLMLYYKKYKKEGLLEFLKKLEAKCLSDIICRETPTRRLETINEILKVIENSKKHNDVLDEQNIFKWEKSKVMDIIKTEDIYGRSFDKYLLLKYEYLNQDNVTEITKYKNLSIEHILPQKPQQNSQWKNDFNQDEIDKWTNNIANLMLLEGRKNSKLGNLDFEKKKAKLKDMKRDIFKGTKEVLEEPEWTPAVLQKRLDKMCKTLFN